MNEHAAKAKDIISKIIYVTIATYSRQGKPWITPVYSAFDEEYNFFWVSGRQTQHSKNISENNEVAMVIYDSTVPEGTGQGVYIDALVFELSNDNEIERAAKYLYGRKNKPPRDLFAFTDNSPRRIYKAQPQKMWVNSSEDVNGHPVDTRIEIPLDELMS